jgi:hypothetical protein
LESNIEGKTRWVFRQPNGLLAAWFYTDGFPYWMVSLDWTHAADGRPSGSSLQAVEQVDGMNPPKTTANQLDESKNDGEPIG